MDTLLLEIGLEEIPARFVRSSSEQLKERMQSFLLEKRIAYGTIKIFATPRRLAVLVENVADKQTDLHVKAKGPAKKIAQDAEGNWTKAALGFARGQGVAPESLYFETIKDVDYVYADKEEIGTATKSVLEQLSDVIKAMTFPVTMRWSDQTFEYIRPIHWIVAMYGKDVIPFNFLGIETGQNSRGHRFLGKEAVITQADAYEEALKEEFVIADLEERKAMIQRQMHTLEEKHGWTIPVDDELLEEVVSLVEYPTAFYGSYEEKYLALPAEVLITSMKGHQRYFEVTDQSGKLLPYFVSVRNGNDVHLESVVKGNQKVLTARLEDALFFYEEDQKHSIEAYTKKLATVSFHAKIGSIAQKMATVSQLAEQLANEIGLSDEDKALLERASHIYKFDLVTNMVGEFPELQGIMGEKYALAKGEPKEVATAIREHYMPLSSDSALPQSLIGSVLAVADKLDSIISFFKQDMIPTGSNDPYALRRQMIGIVQILEANGWSFSLEFFLKEALQHIYAVTEEAHVAKLTADLQAFAKGRVQQRLQQANIEHNIQEAVLNATESDLVVIMENAHVLHDASTSPHYKEVIESLARVVNISAKVKQPDVVDVNLFESTSEKNLYVQINHVKTIWLSATRLEKYLALEALLPYITAYFEENMVMVDNHAVRENRLNMLAILKEKIISFADVRKLVTK